MIDKQQSEKLEEIAKISNDYKERPITVYSLIKVVLLALEARDMGIKSKDMI